MASINEDRITAEERRRSGCVNSSQILCRQDKAGPVVTCATYVVLSSVNVCDMHLFHGVEPHYLGALLVILAPHQRSIVLQKRRKNISYG